MMTILLGQKPLADFTNPIEMLKDCHRRIEHFLDTLRTLERTYRERALDDAGRRALEWAVNYFANFAPRHTADEEESLFPRLRHSEDPDVRASLANIDGLEHDHRRCEECHALVDQRIRQWLRAGELGSAERLELRGALDELAAIYAAHIQLEEQQVFSLAARILTTDQVSEIGHEMKARRALIHG
jgi:hemerythrin-like domain-containing protein